MNIADYAEQLQQEAIALADSDPDDGGGLRLEAFTRLVGERLTDAGEIDDLQVAFHRARGVELSAWYLDVEGDTMHLVTTDYRGAGLETLGAAQIDTHFRRLTTFVERSVHGYADTLEEASPAFEVADLIRSRWTTLRTARLYLLSDARARDPQLAAGTLEGVDVTYHVWDLERLHRLDTSGLAHEPIVVDLTERLGGPLPALPGPEECDHTVYLTMLPASLLAELYDEYGGRLLERNVRSFLQVRGAVNRGIRDTILKSPDRFLAYNNGVSATASRVDLGPNTDGVASLCRIHDLQIVNGGQTTASLASAARRDGADLDAVHVQAKLTVVADDVIDELVAHISQFSNTQNKVTGADFSANDPFHAAVEALSRTFWAPATDGSQRQTHWYYERARGQYADEQARARTPARRRQFRTLNPPTQKFTKTDLAKFEHSWEQLPQTVSLGAEKNFRQFMLRLQLRRVTPDPDYFQRLVAKAILFRTTEKLVSAFRFGGYRANIVTYSIAKLAHTTSSRLDLAAVWRNQTLSDATRTALDEVIPLVHDVIVTPVGRVRHIGEWCKKDDCWAAVRELDWTAPAALRSELVALRADGAAAATLDLGLATITDEETALVEQAREIDADTWFRVSNWAKETGNLQPWQRSIAYSLGRLAAGGKAPSVKQARQGLKLLDEGRRLGFS